MNKVSLFTLLVDVAICRIKSVLNSASFFVLNPDYSMEIYIKMNSRCELTGEGYYMIML